MSRATWSVQDAKNGFSAVVAAARRGQPQTVTKHGKPSVVVVAAEDYDRLCAVEKRTAPGFAAHLLAMPGGQGEFERLEGRLRDSGV